MESEGYDFTRNPVVENEGFFFNPSASTALSQFAHSRSTNYWNTKNYTGRITRRCMERQSRQQAWLKINLEKL
jgi:hypothetical protein